MLIKLLRLISILLPTMAAKIVRNLILTPRIAAHKQTLPQADATIEVNEDTQLKLWQGSGKTVLLMHGWSGSVEDFTTLFHALRARGYRIVAPIPAGHGKTNSGLSHPGKFIQAIEDCIARVNLPVDVAIGHSMGASALGYIAARRDDFEQLILIAPAIDFTEVLAKLSTKLGLTPVAKQKFLQLVDELVGIPREQLNLMMSSKLLSRGGMLVHDLNDKEVAFNDVLRLQQSWSGSKLFRTQGLGHRRILNDELVCEQIVLFTEAAN